MGNVFGQIKRIKQSKNSTLPRVIQWVQPQLEDLSLLEGLSVKTHDPDVNPW